MKRLSVIIPTYNERGNIRKLIEMLEKILANIDFEIVVVDDNSPDGTGEVAEELAKQYGNIRVIHRPGKLGLASAVIDGIRNSNGRYICVMDADLQHPPQVIPRMLQFADEGYDLIVASRYTEQGGVVGWSLWRKIASRIATILAKTLIPASRATSDPMSGFFMFKRRIVRIESLDPVGYKILLEILAKGRHEKVIDVPYVFQRREIGKSKLSSKEILEYVKHLIKLKCIRKG